MKIELTVEELKELVKDVENAKPILENQTVRENIGEAVSIKFTSNLDEESEKIKELVSLLERANELILSQKPINITL